MRYKRILFVLEHFYPYIGGAEKLFYQLSTELIKHGFQVTVLTTRFQKELAKEEWHKGVKIVRINSRNRFSFTFLSLPKIIKLANKHDLIHTTTYNAALPAVVGGKLAGKKVFVTFHEVWGDLWKQLPFISFWQKNAFYAFEQLLLKMPFDKFIAVSDFTKNSLLIQGVSSEKIVRIYNGIDYDSFSAYSPIPPATFTFTYFGRLGISKGLDLLIPAIASLTKITTNFSFKLIIPTSPSSVFKQIIQLIEKYKLHNQVELLHNLPKNQLRQEILNSSCVVISSYSEGFCFAAAETVALSIPIVSSNQGALSEVVSGKLINIKSMDVQGVTDALERAYRNDWQIIPVRHFHLQNALNEYLQLYLDRIDIV